MTRGTRYFILGAVATLGVGLGAGFLAYYVGFPLGALAPAEGPAELHYIPSDAALVAYADVRDVMDSDLRQRLRGLEPAVERDGQAEFEARTGINIEADVDRVVACVTPGGTEPGADNALVLARGRFDEVRLEGLAREQGGVVESYKGRRLLTRPSDEPGGQNMAMAFLEAGLIAMGSDQLVRRAIDLAAGGENVTSNEDVMRLVRQIDGNAWAVGRFDALSNRARLPQNVLNQIPAITWFSASGRVNGGVSGIVQAEARDETAAQNLRDVVQGFIALARLQSNAQPAVGTMLQSLQLGGTGNTVSLSFTVPAEVFDRLAPGSPEPPPPQ